MYDYLKELFYHETESNRLRFDETEAYRVLDVDLDRCREEIAKVLGRSFFNEYWELLMERSDLEHLACFRCGFRIAVRLMMG